MKKLLLLAALSVATTSVFAQAKNFEGPSAALSFAAVGVDTKFSYADADGANGSTSFGKTSFVTGLDLSYAKAIDSNWLMGFGITYDLNKTKAGEFSDSDDQGTSSLSIKAKNHYSVYVQPTYALNNSTALFAKVGYHSMKGEMTYTDGSSDSEKFKGIGYGFGVKTFVNKNLFIQAEAQIVDFKNKSFSDEDGSWGYKVKSNAGIISVGYKF
jgi:opacity protein-like surface antigen